MKEKINELIKSIVPGADTASSDFIADGVLESMSVLRLVSALEDEFDIDISAGQVIKDNFKSTDAIADFVERMQDEQ